MTSDELYGRDVKLDGTLTPVITASGEMAVATGLETVAQEVALRVFTYLGGLWYDRDFGSLAPDWIREENTEINRMGLVSEIILRVQRDPRVLPETVTCRVIRWDETGVSLDCRFSLIETDHPLNIIFRLGGDGAVSFAVKDLNI